MKGDVELTGQFRHRFENIGALAMMARIAANKKHVDRAVAPCGIWSERMIVCGKKYSARHPRWRKLSRMDGKLQTTRS